MSVGIGSREIKTNLGYYCCIYAFYITRTRVYASAVFIQQLGGVPDVNVPVMLGYPVLQQQLLVSEHRDGCVVHPTTWWCPCRLRPRYAGLSGL